MSATPLSIHLVCFGKAWSTFPWLQSNSWNPLPPWLWIVQKYVDKNLSPFHAVEISVRRGSECATWRLQDLIPRFTDQPLHRRCLQYARPAIVVVNQRAKTRKPKHAASSLDFYSWLRDAMEAAAKERTEPYLRTTPTTTATLHNWRQHQQSRTSWR